MIQDHGAEKTVIRDPDRQIPEKIGRYLIRGILGEGAMGRVFLAYDPVIERQVALKMVHAHLLQTGQGDEFLQRFRREAKAAGRLSHPNIVAIYDYAEYASSAFLAMEYVEGEPLQALLAQGRRLESDEILSLMRQLLDALAYAHRHGVVHRDIKPANLILLPNGRLKITDFGVAHLDDSEITRTGVMMGSPAYMAPEQCLGLQVDGRTDLFSAGVVLYELLTGERPFTGQQSTVVVQRILASEPDPPSRINPLLSKPLDSVVLKALAKKPENRYRDAESFLQALEKALRSPPPHPRTWWMATWGTGAVLTAAAVIAAVYYSCCLPEHSTQRESVTATSERPAVEIPSGAGEKTTHALLEVDTIPPHVLVLQQGNRFPGFLGITPFRIPLSPGTYRLIFRKYGYRTELRTIEVDQASSHRLKVKLQRRDGQNDDPDQN